jgi:hypothetical protein
MGLNAGTDVGDDSDCFLFPGVRRILNQMGSLPEGSVCTM